MIQVQSPFPIATEVDTPFTMYDLDMALRRLKSNKASGPNEVPGEIYKHAPFVLKLYLLAHYNQCYQEAKVPPSWLFSEVVMIIKSTQKTLGSFPIIALSLSPIFLIKFLLQ